MAYEGNFLMWPRLLVAYRDDIEVIIKFLKENLEPNEYWFEGNEEEIIAIHFKNEEDLNFIKILYNL